MTFDLGFRKPLAKPEGWHPTLCYGMNRQDPPACCTCVYIGGTSQGKLQEGHQSFVSHKEQWSRKNGHPTRTAVLRVLSSVHLDTLLTPPIKDRSVRSITCRLFLCWKTTESNAFQL